MNKTLHNIKEQLHDNDIDNALESLNSIIACNPDNDEAYFLIGNTYCKKNDWQQALNAYCQAIKINPNSPATIAKDQLMEILCSYNHDIYNP